MSSTFKWIAMKAGTALGRNVSSLFYQLLYREIYREMYDITHDGKKTVEDSYKLGYVAAKESAERQSSVFRFFPSEPIKVLEYVPLLWQIYFGQAMQDYTTEWDLTDPIRPILTYRIKVDPMTFDMGTDPERDNLPFDELWTTENGYGALMAGLLTQVSSHVLKVKGKAERITLKNSSNPLHGDPVFEFKCQIFPSEDELPDFNFDHSTTYKNKKFQESGATSNNKFDGLWDKISENIDIEKLDDMFESPAGMIRVPLSNIIEKTTGMTPYVLFEHFAGDEEKFIQILGFISIHITNEWGQIPETFFNIEAFAKVYAHLFLFMRQNASKFVPVTVVNDLKDYMIEVFEGIAPQEFIFNLQNIDSEKILDLIYFGMEKALKDLGIKFENLKGSIYEEFKKPLSVSEEDADKFDPAHKAERDKLVSQIVDKMMIISMAVLSIPSQMAMVLIYDAISGSSNLISSLFKTIRDSGQELIDLTDKLKDYN